MDEYLQNDHVMIHGLGDDKKYRGVVTGVSKTGSIITNYIVELIDTIDETYQYTHAVIPNVCLYRRRIDDIPQHVKEEQGIE